MRGYGSQHTWQKMVSSAKFNDKGVRVAGFGALHGWYEDRASAIQGLPKDWIQLGYGPPPVEIASSSFILKPLGLELL